MTAEHYDVIIIGTGAGGGTLARKLAPSGKRILLLERGGYLPREPENWDSRGIFQKDRYLSDEFWYDKNGEAFKPHEQYFVGGNTKFYGTILYRLRERDFGEVQHYGGSHQPGRSRIKISSRITQRRRSSISCAGRRARTPTESPRSGPFPYPAVSHRVGTGGRGLACAGRAGILRGIRSVGFRRLPERMAARLAFIVTGMDRDFWS